MRMRILLEEALCDEAMAHLAQSGAEIVVDATLASVATADAVILTGKANVPEAMCDVDTKVQVVGCLGKENEGFDRQQATRAGMLILAPRRGEAASVADYALQQILAMARKRKVGPAMELSGKTLGFVGFPPVGAEVAKRAQGFGMELLCYDQNLARGRAALYHCESTSLVDLLVRSNFVLLLAEPDDWSTSLIGKDEIQLLKKGAGLICLADPQIFRWEELVRALDWGYLEYFAIDLPERQAALAKDVAAYGTVTVAEAANTSEARIAGQLEMAKDVAAALTGAQVDTATNLPRVHAANLKEGERWCTLAYLLGVFMGQRLKGLPKQLEIEEAGAVPVAESAAIVASVLAGFAEGCGEKKINRVNSRLWAEERGISVAVCQRDDAAKHSLRLALEAERGRLQVAGTCDGGANSITQVDAYHLQGHLYPHILLVPHENKPGVIGQVGTLLGEKQVNIAEMVLGYKPHDRSTALMWMQLDQPLAKNTSEESQRLASVLNMEIINLPID